MSKKNIFESIGQSRLEKLCENRDLETEEVFQWNAFYGFDSIIKRYVGLPKNYSLKGVWPHGVPFYTDSVLEAERSTPLDTVFCYPPYRASVYRENTDKVVIPSAHPLLYLLDLIDAPDIEREGTLFFPQHSTHHVTAEMNYAALAEKLVELDSEYQPVSVCLYWKDLNLGRDAPFRERDLPIVSAGHMFDPKFLHRLFILCVCHEYAAGNGIGSHIIYSTAAGCSYFHVEGADHELTGDDEILERDTREPDASILERIRNTFGSRPVPPWEEQKKEADYFLGANYKKSRTGLLLDLARAEVVDKFRVPQREKKRIAHALPPFWQRAVIPKIGRVRNALFG